MERRTFFVLLVIVFQQVVAFFEYGLYTAGDAKVLQYEGTIPPFVPIYRMNMPPAKNLTNPNVNYTYIEVHFLTNFTEPRVIYDGPERKFTFFIRFPLYTIPFTIKGYAQVYTIVLGG